MTISPEQIPLLRYSSRGYVSPLGVVSPLPERVFRFIDLFAGIGGLRLAMEHIGGKCVFTCERDRHSQKTYRANFPDDGHDIAGDIREVDPASVPEHDVLCAGFPCQPFSRAGVSKRNSLDRPHGFQCKDQGNLFFEVAKMIRHHRPAAFLLENVKHLQRHDGGRTFRTIMDILEGDLGYRVFYRVLDSSAWVPQKRQRIFICGFRNPVGFDFGAMEVPKASPKLGEILDPLVDAKYVLTEHLWQYLQNYREKHQRKGNGFGYGLVGDGDVSRTLSARYYKDGSEILVSRGEGEIPRRLSPRECARLMGFDEFQGSLWKIPVSDMQAYRQFGNSVVVPVVRAVARHMSPHIQDIIQ